MTAEVTIDRGQRLGRHDTTVQYRARSESNAWREAAGRHANLRHKSPRKIWLEDLAAGCNCDIPVARKAAEIVPARRAHNTKWTSGLLLRTDGPTLLDLGLLSINSKDYAVVIADSLCGTVYETFAGRRLRMPRETTTQPDAHALDWHRRQAGL